MLRYKIRISSTLQDFHTRILKCNNFLSALFYLCFLIINIKGKNMFSSTML